MPQTYKELKDEVKAEQSAMTPDEIRAKLQKESEYMVDLNNIPQQNHNWVDRGIVISCENGGHANHQVYKRR